jgi:hypothetical protein
VIQDVSVPQPFDDPSYLRKKAKQKAQVNAFNSSMSFSFSPSLSAYVPAETTDDDSVDVSKVLKSKMKHNKQVISDWHSFYQ